MKFTVEVEDFYLEEGELASELKHQLKQSVVSEIRESIKKQVNDYVENYIKLEINEELKTRVKIIVDEFIKNGKVKGRYSNDPERPVEVWISESIQHDHAKIYDHIGKAVEKHTKALKDRYDLMFATSLITKIKEQGFLKEEAAKLLLTDEPTS